MAPIDTVIIKNMQSYIKKLTILDQTASELTNYCNNENKKIYNSINREIYNSIKIDINWLKIIYFNRTDIKIQFTFVDQALHLVFIHPHIYEQVKKIYDDLGIEINQFDFYFKLKFIPFIVVGQTCEIISFITRS